METNEAIMAFCQSEKIKAGLIWTSQTIELVLGLPEEQKKGAEKTVHVLLNMVSQEISLAKALARHEAWSEAEPHIEKALIMINSGVSHEAGIHLSKALSKITNIGQQSMSLLQERHLL
jgi:flagellin-specific chaperone FliS